MGLPGEAVVNLDSALKASIGNILIELTKFIPKFLVAVLIFVVGWIIASLFSWVVKKVLHYLSLEKFLKTHKLEDSLGRVKISNLLVKLSKYYILLIFLQASVAMLDLGTITQFMSSVLLYAPIVIGALLILAAAAVLGELLREKVIEIEEKSRTVRWFGDATKAIVVFLGIMVGLTTIGFNTTIITNSFLAILQGVVYGIALAFGIAFGLGGQDDAKDVVKKFRKQTGI